MRYVQHESAILNLSRNCAITQTNCDKKPECLKQLNHLVQENTKHHLQLLKATVLILKHKMEQVNDQNETPNKSS